MSSHIRKLAFSLIIIVVLLTSVTSGLSSDWGIITPNDWTTQPPKDFVHFGAIVLFDSSLATAERSGLRIQRHIRTRVLDNKGAEKLRTVEIAYGIYDSLKQVQARIVRRNPVGRQSIRSVPDEAITHRWVGERQIETIDLGDLASGDIIEYKYTVTRYGGFDRFEDRREILFNQDMSFTELEVRERMGTTDLDRLGLKKAARRIDHYFDHPFYTVRSILILKIGSDIEYIYYTSNLSRKDEDPSFDGGGGIIQRVYNFYKWDLKGLAPYQVEPHMASSEIVRAAVRFSLYAHKGLNKVFRNNFSYKYWNDVGKNFQGYLNKYSGKSNQFKKAVRKLTAETDNQRQKAKRICAFVAKEFKTVRAVADLRPAHVDMKKLFKKKYGTAFEKNMLLAYMLKFADIDAWPMLISTRDRTPATTSGRFNNMIVYAEFDQGGIFLDATSPYIPFGAVHPNNLVAEGLVIDYDQSDLLAISPDTVISFRLDSCSISITSGSSATIQTRTILSGYAAVEIAERLDQQDSAVVASDLWYGQSKSQYRLNNFSFAHDDRDRLILTTNSTLEITSVEPSNQYVLAGTIPWFEENPFESVHRRYDIDFGYPMEYRFVMNIDIDSLPRNISVEAVDTLIAIPGMSFHRSVSVEGGVVRVKSELIRDRSEYPLGAYAQLRQFFSDVSGWNRRKISIQVSP